ncbi:MAG: ribosome maturation factor RimM [Synergistaceae bacterium]|jgi:16S rRNA processing protein RimM|nr:ribosome maturation factor RimM [Synergistaceae bacterium]
MSISRKNFEDGLGAAKRPTGRTMIGKIVGAHGVRGTLRIHPLTDYPERFLGMRTLYIEKQGKPHRELEVTGIAAHEGKGQFLASVSGISDRESAEAFSGYVVTVAPDERVELPEGEYWIDSLIGLDVIDAESGGKLGEIEDVMPTGGNDVYQVRAQDGSVKMIPAVADVVKEIDLDAGVVKVSLPEGLWD